MISIEVNGLSKAFNRKVVFKNLTFNHESGVLGIAGANGSGKSTLLQCLAFLQKPNAGLFEWMNDGEIISRAEFRSHIGFIAPYINLYPNLTLTENLMFILRAGGVKDFIERVNEVIEQFDLGNIQHQELKTLSTGQRQRVKLASAIIRNPTILLLDEPGSNLDDKGFELVSSLIKTQREKGTLLLLASNDAREISLCDEVLTLGV